jgi:hypothetical protein
MCVIAIVHDKRPSQQMIEDMWKQNSHGGGMAWREGEGENAMVRWSKGLKLQDMINMCRELPTPYVAHFRIASVGGVRPDLTHPFAIDEIDLSTDLEGETQGAVLFHNGHWNEWRKCILESALTVGSPIPRGKWSDSRAMAFLTKLYGQGFLELIDEKTVYFSPTMLDVLGNGWSKVEEIWCSNDFFKKTTQVHSTGTFTSNMCKLGRCTRQDNLDSLGYCPEHTTVKKALTPPTEGRREVAPPLTPFELRQKAAKMELEWAAFKAGKLNRTDLDFSKQDLKRYRAAVNELPPLPA